MDRGDNIPRMNVVRLPPIGALEAETFVRAVAQDVFANDEERDLTLAKAAEWFEAKATSIFPETPGTEISSPTAAGLFFADWVRIGGQNRRFRFGLGVLHRPVVAYRNSADVGHDLPKQS